MKVLIVAKCNVNADTGQLRMGWHRVLIVAKCNINWEIKTGWVKDTEY